MPLRVPVIVSEPTAAGIEAAVAGTAAAQAGRTDCRMQSPAAAVVADKAVRIPVVAEGTPAGAAAGAGEDIPASAYQASSCR